MHPTYEETHYIGVRSHQQAYRIVVHQQLSDLLLGQGFLSKAFSFYLTQLVQVFHRCALYHYPHSSHLSTLRTEQNLDLFCWTCVFIRTSRDSLYPKPLLRTEADEEP